MRWCGAGGVRASLPALQTLIVLWLEPNTMLLPSGEKATDGVVPLCAICASPPSAPGMLQQAGERSGLG